MPFVYSFTDPLDKQVSSSEIVLRPIIPGTFIRSGSNYIIRESYFLHRYFTTTTNQERSHYSVCRCWIESHIICSIYPVPLYRVVAAPEYLL